MLDTLELTDDSAELLSYPSIFGRCVGGPAGQTCGFGREQCRREVEYPLRIEIEDVFGGEFHVLGLDLRVSSDEIVTGQFGDRDLVAPDDHVPTGAVVLSGHQEQVCNLTTENVTGSSGQCHGVAVADQSQ